MNDKNTMNIDYVISTEDGTRKNESGIDAIARVFPLGTPVWQLNIDGRPDNFIKVYKNNSQQQ